MRQVAFMTLASDDRVSCWDVDSSSGKLTLLSHIAVDGRPAPLAVDAHPGHRLHADVSALQIPSRRTNQGRRVVYGYAQTGWFP